MIGILRVFVVVLVVFSISNASLVTAENNQLAANNPTVREGLGVTWTSDTENVIGRNYRARLYRADGLMTYWNQHVANRSSQRFPDTREAAVRLAELRTRW